MRPKSIILFERFFIGSLILGVFNSVINRNNELEMLASDPNTAGYGAGYLVFISAFVWAISLLFWYFIARKASNVAKWIFIVFFGIGLIMLPFTIFQNPPLVSAIIAIMSVMQAYALYLLFRPDAKEWFSTKGKVADLEKTFE